MIASVTGLARVTSLAVSTSMFAIATGVSTLFPGVTVVVTAAGSSYGVTLTVVVVSMALGGIITAASA